MSQNVPECYGWDIVFLRDTSNIKEHVEVGNFDVVQV